MLIFILYPLAFIFGKYFEMGKKREVNNTLGVSTYEPRPNTCKRAYGQAEDHERIHLMGRIIPNLAELTARTFKQFSR